MKQLFTAVQLVALFIIQLIAVSCTPEISVSVIIPDTHFEKNQDKTKIYLLTSEEYETIQSIKARNSVYYRTKLMSITDSLKVLKSGYESIYAELAVTSENCSTLLQQLPIEYCSKVEVKPIKISKYSDVWQLSVSLNNNGNEDIWGLVMSLKYKDITFIKQNEYSIFLQPNERHQFNNINFNLSNNIPLQYSMATYPGGLNKMLQEALTIEVDSVISMFSTSLSECNDKMDKLEQDMETIGITIDIYAEQIAEYLDYAVIKPVNRIIEENLRLTEKKNSIAVKDTVIFNELNKGGYQLLVYSDANADSTQYVIPVDLTQAKQATINIKNYNPQLLFLNKGRFIKNIPLLPGQ